MAGDAMNELLSRLTIPLALLLCACGASTPSTDAEPPLAGARIGGPFALTDQNGAVFRDTDLAGKYRIMYFGYTYCPDVCPVDMQNIAAAMRLLEREDMDAARKIVPVFVSVDPERDTPAVLKEFVGNFHPRTISLTGTPEAIAAMTKSFAVYSTRRESPDPDAYLVDHSRQSYLMGPEGQPIALVPADDSPRAVADTLKRWVR